MESVSAVDESIMMGVRLIIFLVGSAKRKCTEEEWLVRVSRIAGRIVLAVSEVRNVLFQELSGPTLLRRKQDQPFHCVCV